MTSNETYSSPNSDGPLSQIQQLVERAKKGDKEAFGEIYKLHYKAVSSYVTQQGFKNHDNEDVVNEVFTRAFAKIHSFTWQGKDILAWLYRIAQRIIRDRYKSAETRSQSENPGSWRFTSRASRSTVEETVVERLTTNEQWAVLAQAFARLLTPLEATTKQPSTATKKLGQQYLRYLTMAYVEHLSLSEIAQRTGKTTSAVKSTLARARAAVKRAVQPRPPRKVAPPRKGVPRISLTTGQINAVTGLSTEQISLLVMRYVEGLTLEQISSETGYTLEKVRAKIETARKRFKKPPAKRQQKPLLRLDPEEIKAASWLSEEQTQLLTMRYVEGLTYVKIASQKGWNQAMARDRTDKALHLFNSPQVKH